MNLIENLEYIHSEIDKISNLDDFNREVLIHLKNGQTATSELGMFCADFEKQTLIGILNNEVKTFKFSEIRVCVII